MNYVVTNDMFGDATQNRTRDASRAAPNTGRGRSPRLPHAEGVSLGLVAGGRERHGLGGVLEGVIEGVTHEGVMKGS